MEFGYPNVTQTAWTVRLFCSFFFFIYYFYFLELQCFLGFGILLIVMWIQLDIVDSFLCYFVDIELIEMQVFGAGSYSGILDMRA